MWSPRPTLTEHLAQRILARERAAVAPALNAADDARPRERRAALQMLAQIEAQTAHSGAHRIGLTGAPGAGKSTLLGALLRRLQQRGETLGVIAVDPSSPHSGGALLGDRLRARTALGELGGAIFFRSLAARDRLGGLAESARAAVLVLGAVFDTVLVETVGVGQSEGEVADLVDTLIYVAQPGAGDLLQTLKAGVLELPDLVVVNKADLGPAAAQHQSELQAGLALTSSAEPDDLRGGWQPPTLLVSAQNGSGISELLQAADRHRAWLQESAPQSAQTRLAARRLRGRNRYVQSALLRRYGSYGLEAIGGSAQVSALLAQSSNDSGFQVLRQLSAQIEAALTVGGGISR